MNLHISRPALIEAFQRQGKDITKATPQEMRSLVCAQCHVEYFFKGDGKYLSCSALSFRNLKFLAILKLMGL
jgi:nitrite reductase (cytochrome c-552)